MKPISYITNEQIENYACDFYLKFGEKIDFRTITTKLFEKGKNHYGIPMLPYEISWDTLTDTEFFTLLKNLPIQNLFANYHASSDYIPASPIIPPDLDVYAIYYIQNIKDHRHAHDFFEINYVFSGECHMLFENETLTLSSGELCIISPGSMHDMYASDDSIAVSIMIRKDTFENTFFRLLSQKNLLADFFRTILYSETEKANYLFFTTNNSFIIHDSIKTIFMDCYILDSYSNTCAISRIHIFFSILLRRFSHTIQIYNESSNVTDQTTFLLILQYIQNHYQTVSLDVLCSVFHYNKSYLSRLIHKNSGRNFIDIVTDLKLSQAIDLLNNTALSIAEISELIGYNNVDHFSKHFKKKYSIPPSVYRTNTIRISSGTDKKDSRHKSDVSDTQNP